MDGALTPGHDAAPGCGPWVVPLTPMATIAALAASARAGGRSSELPPLPPASRTQRPRPACRDGGLARSDRSGSGAREAGQGSQI